MVKAFSDFIGNSRAIKQLMALTKKPPNCLILVGPRKVGKATAALEYMWEVLGDPKSRWLLETGKEHPDVKWLEYEIGSMLPREVSAFVKGDNFRPIISNHKFHVVDFLSAPSKGNNSILPGLLKTLEEPPGRLTIILIVPDLDYLLGTILSRSVTVRFNTPSHDDLTALVKLRYPDAEEDVIAKCLKLVGNNMGAVLSTEPDELYQMGENILKFLWQIRPAGFWEQSQFCTALQEEFNLTTAICVEHLSMILNQFRIKGKWAPAVFEQWGTYGIARIIQIILEAREIQLSRCPHRNLQLFMESAFIAVSEEVFTKAEESTDD